MLQVEELRGGYGDTEVLHGISLEVKEGEILVVMGGSGCGKTTFLRYLMGLKKPREGIIRAGGLDLSSMSSKQYRRFCRSIVVLFQSGALLNSMSVGENVAFPLKEHTTLADSVIRRMVSMKLDQVELRGTEDMMPSELSGGMRKRAGLARALVLDPGLLLLDEPTTGLDPIIAADIDELVLNIREAYGASMVVVAHDIESGLHIADRLVIFRDGKIVAQGTPQEIKNSQNPYVRQFLQRRPNKPQERPPLFHKQTGIVKT
jgi:phospholipid/cholesterol/gamma-HCH transport system ATP-binding protein